MASIELRCVCRTAFSSQLDSSEYCRAALACELVGGEGGSAVGVRRSEMNSGSELEPLSLRGLMERSSASSSDGAKSEVGV